MSKVYIISDLHFRHASMAKFRGFKSVEEQDDLIISNWNKIINKRDLVWILGDITMEKKDPQSLLGLLNGQKKIILGNHDMPQHTPNLLLFASHVGGMVKYKKKYILTHSPMHPQEIYTPKINIHGHIHKKEHLIDSPKYICVTAEFLDYTPIEFNELIEKHNKKWNL